MLEYRMIANARWEPCTDQQDPELGECIERLLELATAALVSKLDEATVTIQRGRFSRVEYRLAR